MKLDETPAKNLCSGSQSNAITILSTVKFALRLLSSVHV
jgi:hypothetical protein